MSTKRAESQVPVTCLCLGPTGSGKTMLLRRLRGRHVVDGTTSTVPTAGTDLVPVPLPSAAGATAPPRTLIVRELGGQVAPLWHHYYDSVTKVVFVVDASNLCQIAAAGVLLYTALAEPRLHRASFLLALAKMDASYRQMRNEALLILQFGRLKREVPQRIDTVEVSATTDEGVDDVLAWLAQK